MHDRPNGRPHEAITTRERDFTTTSCEPDPCYYYFLTLVVYGDGEGKTVSNLDRFSDHFFPWFGHENLHWTGRHWSRWEDWSCSQRSRGVVVVRNGFGLSLVSTSDMVPLALICHQSFVRLDYNSIKVLYPSILFDYKRKLSLKTNHWNNEETKMVCFQD